MTEFLGTKEEAFEIIDKLLDMIKRTPPIEKTKEVKYNNFNNVAYHLIGFYMDFDSKKEAEELDSNIRKFYISAKNKYSRDVDTEITNVLKNAGYNNINPDKPHAIEDTYPIEIEDSGGRYRVFFTFRIDA